MYFESCTCSYKCLCKMHKVTLRHFRRLSNPTHRKVLLTGVGMAAFLVILSAIFFDQGAILHYRGAFTNPMYRFSRLNQLDNWYTPSSDTITKIGIYTYIKPQSGVYRDTDHAIWSYFNSTILSFCDTASPSYNYTINLIFHPSDKILAAKAFQAKLTQKFEKYLLCNCTEHIQDAVKLSFVPVFYAPENIAWAFGELLWNEYIKGIEYFYLKPSLFPFHKDWIEQNVDNLRKRKPMNFGVTYSEKSGEYFFHATHMEVFGWVYPRIYKYKEATNWLQSVYPMIYSTHRKDYESDGHGDSVIEERVEKRLNLDRETLERYKNFLLQKKTLDKGKSRKIISMSLYGDDMRYTHNAVRNVLLAWLNFPSWILRFYIEMPDQNGKTQYKRTPKYVLDKLESLGAELKTVNLTETNLLPKLWRFMVADDPKVDLFIVRDCDSRLTERDATVVNDWLNTTEPFHCIRDHPSHGHFAVKGGLWGARRREISRYFNKSFTEMMTGHYSEDSLPDVAFLGETVWTQVKDHAYCHDSVTCDRWPNSHPFPIKRKGPEFLGALYDAYGMGKRVDIDIINFNAVNPYCEPK